VIVYIMTYERSTLLNSEKYIGLDVHQATISLAVMDSKGKLVMESILETKAATILEFFAGLRGTLLVTFEEGTWAAWLYDLLKPHVAKLVVCNPRKNALLKHGNKSDRIDARKLADLLRLMISSRVRGEKTEKFRILTLRYFDCERTTPVLNGYYLCRCSQTVLNSTGLHGNQTSGEHSCNVNL
jgi:Transposase